MKKDDIIKTFNLLQTDKNTKKVFDADVSARIPYRLHCCVYNFSREVWVEDDILYNYDLGGNCQTLKILNERGTCLMYYQIRPYLRPMSSMTEKEKTYFQELLEHTGNITLIGNLPYLFASTACYDWLNSHHFDYRGLIDKGLALEAPSDMYKFND